MASWLACTSSTTIGKSYNYVYGFSLSYQYLRLGDNTHILSLCTHNYVLYGIDLIRYCTRVLVSVHFYASVAHAQRGIR